LPQQGQRIMVYAIFLTQIAEAGGPIARQMVALIEGAQKQKAGIAGDLAAGKIGPNEVMAVEREGQLWYNTLYQAMDAPKGNAGCARPSVHTPFRASFLLWLPKSVNNPG
jgi:hypothetical protein